MLILHSTNKSTSISEKKKKNHNSMCLILLVLKVHQVGQITNNISIF